MNNYPDSTYETDPRAPWNQEPPKGRSWRFEVCGSCDEFCVMVDQNGDAVGNVCGIDLVRIDKRTPACEKWG